jgi:hypothetical protein
MSSFEILQEYKMPANMERCPYVSFFVQRVESRSYSILSRSYDLHVLPYLVCTIVISLERLTHLYDLLATSEYVVRSS